MEATICQRRLLFAGALARQDDKRLPKRLLFAGRLEGGEDPGPGQPAQHWQKSLRDDFPSRQAHLNRCGAQGGGSAVVHRGSVGGGEVYGVVAQESRRG